MGGEGEGGQGEGQCLEKNTVVRVARGMDSGSHGEVGQVREWTGAEAEGKRNRDEDQCLGGNLNTAVGLQVVAKSLESPLGLSAL